MFISVRYGSDKCSLFNTDCDILYFIKDLQKRCNPNGKIIEQVDLSDESGNFIIEFSLLLWFNFTKIKFY